MVVIHLPVTNPGAAGSRFGSCGWQENYTIQRSASARVRPSVARPKATVVEDDSYWLAKYPSRHDRMDMPLIEYATLRLAAAAGIKTPECRLLTLKSNKGENQHAFLTRLFDRLHTDEGWLRYHYMSGLTVLGLNEFDNAKGGLSRTGR